MSIDWNTIKLHFHCQIRASLCVTKPSMCDSSAYLDSGFVQYTFHIPHSKCPFERKFNAIIVVSNALSPLSSMFPSPKKPPFPWCSKRCQKCVQCFRQHFSSMTINGQVQFVALSVSLIFVYGFQGVSHSSFSLIYPDFFPLLFSLHCTVLVIV